jgi:uncharacterized protein YciI
MAAQQLPHWHVTIPVTIADINVFLETRPSHVAHLKTLVDAGTLVMSGPTIKEHPKEGAAPVVTGGIWIAKAGTAEEVREAARENPFAKVGIWDVDAARVEPFILAVKG